MTEQASAWTTRNGSPTSRPTLTVPARLTWKDARGAVRFASVTTREFNDEGVFVDCESNVALPLYRLVHLQVEKAARDNHGLPAVLKDGRVLSAVWQVGPCNESTGTPGGYALRFMAEPVASRAGDVQRTRRAS